jgi:hypothetical protein
LRLEAYIQAARRGAEVKILLDAVYDTPSDPRSNAATATYVNGIASAEGLNLQCKVGSPTVTGIHNKMVLVWDGSSGWTHTGSINGSENSCKNNREVAVQVHSTQGFNYLANVFNYDWTHQGGGPIVTDPPGEPNNLMVSESAGNLVFSWSAPYSGCNTLSYAVYRGDLSTFASGAYSHGTALTCDVGQRSFTLPLNDGRLGSLDYFLVVANNSVEEGSYGKDSNGQQRPVSSGRCKAYQDWGSCP